MSDEQAQEAVVEPEAQAAPEPPTNTVEAAEAVIDPRIRKANEEAARYRTQLRAQEERVKALELEKLSDQERAEQRAVDAEARANALADIARTNALKAEAVKLGSQYGALDAEAVIALAGNGVTFDDLGMPQNLAEVFETAKTERPYLFAQTKPAASAPSAGAVPGAGSPPLPTEREETWREKRVRVNSGSQNQGSMLDPKVAIAQGGGVFYNGKDLTHKYSNDEVRKFLGSQKTTGDD
jgi:hypothetical protein